MHSELLYKSSSSSSGSGRASLFSTPSLPTTEGRDKATSFNPYSPVRSNQPYMLLFRCRSDTMVLSDPNPVFLQHIYPFPMSGTILLLQAENLQTISLRSAAFPSPLHSEFRENPLIHCYSGSHPHLQGNQIR